MPDHREAALHKAEALYALSRYRDAMEVYSSLPEDHDTLTGLARCSYELAMYHRALEYVDRALEVSRNSVQALLLKGMIHFVVGEYEEAAYALDRLLKLEPEDRAAKELKHAAWERMRWGEARSGKVHEVYLIYRDGRLLAHTSKEGKRMDELVLSSMLTAIQNFISDSFHHDEDLSEITLGKMNIIIERTDLMYLTAIVIGRIQPSLREDMRRLLVRIKDRYYSVLKDWDGTEEGLEGLEDMISELMEGDNEGETSARRAHGP